MPAPPPTLIERLVAWLIRHRTLLFFLALISVVVSIPAALTLEFDQRIESLYAADDPHLADYRRSKKLFGGDELALVAWGQPGLFDDETTVDSTAVDQITRFADVLSDIPGIRPESTQTLVRALEAPIERERVRELMEGLLVDEAGHTTGIVLRFEPEETSPISRGETIRRVRLAAAQHTTRTGHETFVVGEPVQIHDMFRYVEEDGNTFFLWTVALLAIVVFTYFGSLRWTLLPLAVVASSIVWTRALLAVSGLQLSMVSSMLNSIVTIVGVATVTHLTVRFREHRREHSPRDSLELTLVQLLPSVFWTCTTTVVGFAALLSSEIAPVRSFGAMMALGTAFVFVATCTLLPGGALINRSDDDSRLPTPVRGLLTHGLTRLARCVERWPGTLLFSGLGLMAVCFLGLFRLQLETDFSRNFHAQSDIIRSLEFYESRLGGAGTWEVNFPAPHRLDDPFLDRVRELADRLRGIESDGRITKVVAITDGLDLVPATVPNPAAFLGGKPIEVPIARRLGLLTGLQPEFVPGLYNAREGRMRVVIRARERESAERKRELIQRAEAITREAFPESASSSTEAPRATGLYVLLVFLIESLMRDQIVSFTIATVGILATMTFAFRSLRIGLVSLVPNLFPICVVLGSMGWLGLRINIATAMIACVSMGLTTDATVHFIASFRRSRARGVERHEAIAETLRETGRAIVFATIALVIGFSVLTLSHFIPLVYFGILVDAAMIGGMIGDLVLLPILLLWTDQADEGPTTD